MEKRDFRGLGRAAQESLRVRAIYLVLELHKTQAEAAEVIGASRQTVNQWLSNYASDGEKALLDRRRNSPREGKGLLTAAEVRRVRRWLTDKCPEQLKLPMRYGPLEWYAN
jgi:transposase